MIVFEVCRWMCCRSMDVGCLWKDAKMARRWAMEASGCGGCVDLDGL